MPRYARLTLAGRDELGDDLLDGVGRDGEADADVAGRALRRCDLRVDADHLGAVVQQRAARVAAVDRRVGLDHVIDGIAVRRGDRALLDSADDPGSRRAREPERVADRDDGVSDTHDARVPEHERRQAARARLDPEHGDVGGRIATDEGGAQGVLIGEADLDLVGALDHVVVRDDVAGLVDHEARAERLLRRRVGRRTERGSECPGRSCPST